MYLTVEDIAADLYNMVNKQRFKTKEIVDNLIQNSTTILGNPEINILEGLVSDYKVNRTGLEAISKRIYNILIPTFKLDVSRFTWPKFGD